MKHEILPDGQASSYKIELRSLRSNEGPRPQFAVQYSKIFNKWQNEFLLSHNQLFSFPSLLFLDLRECPANVLSSTIFNQYSFQSRQKPPVLIDVVIVSHGLYSNQAIPVGPFAVHHIIYENIVPIKYQTCFLLRHLKPFFDTNIFYAGMHLKYISNNRRNASSSCT